MINSYILILEWGGFLLPGAGGKPGPTNGDIDGDLVAKGDKDGENEGDIAAAEKPGTSWLIGDRGNKCCGCLQDNDGAGQLRGATVVSNGGGTLLPPDIEVPLLLALEAPLLPLCKETVSSFNLAISEKTWANGWYCGPQSNK